MVSFEFLQAAIFILGYAAIIFEHKIHVNKTATALLVATLCWGAYFWGTGGSQAAVDNLSHHLSETSQIVFFLIGAMGIVELIDTHSGFSVITSKLNFSKKTTLLWAIGLISFFLSSVLDNLTTTIAMISILRKIFKETEDRWIFGALVVIAANAGGAWTPIGDVTTTMLWMNGQITTYGVMSSLFLPSFISLIAAILTFQFLYMKKDQTLDFTYCNTPVTKESVLIFTLGISMLILVPVIKSLIHLPPYMGMQIGLAGMWIVTDRIHLNKEDKQEFKLSHVIKKTDLTSALFFMGILLAVASLETTGMLEHLTLLLGKLVPSQTIIATVIGIASSIIDNVPLVAACMGMYKLSIYPVDSSFWQLIAFCAGTGGSLLIIGSAAGVAFMGLEKVPFGWYFKKVTLAAFISYAVGIGAYLLLIG